MFLEKLLWDIHVLTLFLGAKKSQLYAPYIIKNRIMTSTVARKSSLNTTFVWTWDGDGNKDGILSILIAVYAYQLTLRSAG